MLFSGIFVCLWLNFPLLQPLMNFRIPRAEDEFDCYESSSQDETISNQGTNFIGFYGISTLATHCDTLSDFDLCFNGLVMVKGGVVANYSNGPKSGTNLSKKRKRWTEADDDAEDDDDDELYNHHVTEEHYRSMLGEHIQKFKSRSKDSQPNHTHLMGVPMPKSNVSSYRGRKPGNDHHGRFYDMDTTSNFASDAIPQRRGSHRSSDITPKYVIRFSCFIESV